MRFLFLSLMVTFSTQLEAKNMIDHSDWTYLADTVMGGVSTGMARVENLDQRRTMHLKGSVSTENNGGFIQVRANVGENTAKGFDGVRLLVKGNGNSYFIHLRVTGSFVPWHYYQQEFYAPNQWTEIKLPFSKFERSSRMLRKALDPSQVKTLGVVAYGKNYEAEIWISDVEFY
jgi:hypothetical protein